MTDTEHTDTQGRVWRRMSSGGGGQTVFAPPGAGTIPPDVVAWLRLGEPVFAPPRAETFPPDEPTTADSCAALHAATTEAGIAQAWLGSRASRWSKPLVDRVQIIESWIDAQSHLGDDGK